MSLALRCKLHFRLSQGISILVKVSCVIYLFIYLFIHLFVRSFVRSFIYLFIYLFIYPVYSFQYCSKCKIIPALNAVSENSAD